MPAKKKSKVKRRKAAGKSCAKHAGADAGDDETNKQKQGDIDSQMQGLQTDGKKAEDDDEDKLLEEAIKLATAEKKELLEEALKVAATEKKFLGAIEDIDKNCNHGYNPSPFDSRFCHNFMKTFMSSVNASRQSTGNPNVIDHIAEAFKFAVSKYPARRGDGDGSKKAKLLKSRCLGEATYHILKGGNSSNARFFSICAKFFDDVFEKRRQDDAKLDELCGADDHTLVQFVRKQIPCSCLEEKYKQVKSVEKTGRCSNPECPLPDHMAIRKEMVYCLGCKKKNYCSRDCQIAAWPVHKKYCGKSDKELAKLNYFRH